jgi:hypothetical protein
MKLTREQISNLSKTELNRAMVWLYPSALLPEYTLTGKPIINHDAGNFLLAETYSGYECLETSAEINYLTDYNLTMPLAFENELEIDFMKKTRVTECYDGAFSSHENPLRAVAEVLVMIAMEKQS